VAILGAEFKEELERIYKILHVVLTSTLLYGNVCCEMRESNLQKLEAAGIRFVISVKGCAGLDEIMKEVKKVKLPLCITN
jgi:hypothetical protein